MLFLVGQGCQDPSGQGRGGERGSHQQGEAPRD